MMGAALPRATVKPVIQKRTMTLGISYEDVRRERRAEEEEWASKCGPVTVRYIKKDGASDG